MVRPEANEKSEGVGILGIATLVVLVLIFAVVGYLAYTHFHHSSNIVNDKVATTQSSHGSSTNASSTGQSQTAANTANPTTSTATESATGQSVVKISPLNVQISVPNSIDDLIYYSSSMKTSPAATTAVLSTEALSKLDPACGVDSTKTLGIGTLYEYSGTYTANNNPDKTSAWSKQFPSFYVAYNAPTSNCSQSTPTNTVAQAQIASLKSALASMT